MAGFGDTPINEVLPEAAGGTDNTTYDDGQILRWSSSAGKIESCGKVLSDLEQTANKGQTSGYCGLDSGGLVATSDLGSGSASSSTYLRGDQSWQTISAAPYEPAWDHTILFDEFIGCSEEDGEHGELGWSSDGTGSTTFPDAESGHPGILRITTGTSSGNGRRMYLGDNYNDQPVIYTSDLDRVSFLVRLPSVTAIEVSIGIGEFFHLTALGDDSAFFYFNSSYTYWYSYTRTGGVTTNNATDITPGAGTWYLLEIERADANTWKFYIDETLKQTHTTNLPSGAMNVGILCSTTATGAKDCDIDWFRLKTVDLGRQMSNPVTSGLQAAYELAFLMGG